MRKSFILAALAATLTVGAMAQEAPSGCCKRNYLPEKGDWAIGVDVVPLLKTIGGSYSSQESVPVGGTPYNYGDELYLKPNVSVMGKYMFTDKWGLKVNLGLAMRHTNNRYYANDDLGLYLDPNSGAKVVDQQKITRFGGTLMAGSEYRVGRQRVQGVFGAGVLVGFSTYKLHNIYGNEMTDFNRTPTTVLTNPVGLEVPATLSGYRLTKFNSNGPNVNLGCYLSAGVEWFVAPKIALGAEVDLSVYGTLASKGWMDSEGYSTAYERVVTRTDLYTPGSRSCSFGTDNLGGQLYCIFYF